MDIVYASDNSYAEILAVSLTSLLENNKSIGEMRVYVLCDQMTRENQDRLREIACRYNRQLELISLPDMDKLAGQRLHGCRWSKTAFARLYLPTLLPRCRKVVYLDCDTLVCKSIAALEQYSLPAGISCAAVQDCMSRAHKANVGLAPEQYYVNSGVMLIDLEQWRKEHLESQFSGFLQARDGKVPYVDQGVVNGVLKGRVALLPVRYNVMTALFDFSYEDLGRYRGDNPYTRADYLQAKDAPVIVHFTSSFLSPRPWLDARQTHPYARCWAVYHQMTPWAHNAPWPDRRKALTRAYAAVYGRLPRPLAVSVSGFLHRIVKPVADRR